MYVDICIYLTRMTCIEHFIHVNTRRIVNTLKKKKTDENRLPKWKPFYKHYY